MDILGLMLAAGLFVAQDQVPASESLVDASIAQEGVSADLFVVPAAGEAQSFAASLIAAEGLVQWNGGPVTMLTNDGLTLQTVTAGNGQVVSVLYRSNATGEPETKVCRVLAWMNGVGTAAWRAKTWCAAQLGLILPETPAPPIVAR